MNSKGAAQLGRSRSTLIRCTGPGRGVPWSSKWDLECPRNQMQGGRKLAGHSEGERAAENGPGRLGAHSCSDRVAHWELRQAPAPLYTSVFSPT